MLRDAELRSDRSAILFQGSLIKLSRLLVSRDIRAVPQCRGAHDEIPHIGIDCLFLLDPAALRGDELYTESSRQAAGYLALRFCEVSAIGLKPIRPDVRAGFALD